ncbi:MAG: hypothetical protein HRU30_10250 [Rhodobacteraceae bacterium]|nr:hypothetical protein [Paracoccaceae bacterium]
MYAMLALSATLAACSGNPFEEEVVEDPDTGAQITSDRTVPPGTASPQPDASLFRSEPTTADSGNAQSGDGTVSAVSYDSANDEFTVDGLAFDGDNVYSRGSAVGSLNQYAVYEADVQFSDPLNQVPVNQLTHRAIYGVSNTGNTEFAIVRTGGYVGYGFGGFIYQRTGGVNLPTTGQAVYLGQAGGLRDFDGRGGLQYTTADVRVDIDFDDFNDSTNVLGDGVKGSFSNRTIFDLSGNDITDAFLQDFNDKNTSSISSIPDLRFVIGPDRLDANGEIVGELFSTFVDNTGTAQDFETGNYYAILSGDSAQEMVGIYVVTGEDVVGDGQARETGGFIIYR